MNTFPYLRFAACAALTFAAMGVAAQGMGRPSDSPVLVWPDGRVVPVVPAYPAYPAYPVSPAYPGYPQVPAPQYEGLKSGGYPSDRNLNLGDRTPNFGGSGPNRASPNTAPPYEAPAQGGFRSRPAPQLQPLGPGMADRYRRD